MSDYSTELQRRTELLSALSGVSPATAAELATAAVFIDLPPRTVIYKTGDVCAGLYVIASGRVRLISHKESSRRRVIALLGQSAWFDETALVPHKLHAITAETVQHTKLACVASATVIRLLHCDHAFAIKMLTEAARLLRSSHGGRSN